MIPAFLLNLVGGLGFGRSSLPIFAGIGALVLGGLVVAGIYKAGASSQARACQVATIKNERDTARADLAIAQNAARDAEVRAAEIEAAALKNEELVRDLEAKLKKRPPVRACVLSRDDALRLRRIN